MQYKITEMLGVKDSNYPDKKKYEFKVDGNDNKLSAFSKFPMSVGQEIHGDIVQNGQYWNFKWGKKETNPNGTQKPSPSTMSESGEMARLANVISLKLIPAIEANTRALLGQNTPVVEEMYPKMDDTIDADQIPF